MAVLLSLDLPTIFRCAVELAEAAATLNPSEWSALPVDIEGPASPHFERWMERHRRLRRIEEETERLKRCLGATGPLGHAGGEKDGGPKWESYDQDFNNTVHDRVVRLALLKLATSAIDLSGFATWREWQWPMRETGLRLLTWGLAQLWEGMTDQERSSVRDRLRRTHKAVDWPAEPLVDPRPYDGPEEIPLQDQYRIISNYISCCRDYLDGVQKADSKRAEQGQERFLRRATLAQFVEMAERTGQVLQALARRDFDTPEEWGQLYTKAFWPLACLRRAGEIQPREVWPAAALKQRKVLADAAEILLTCVGGAPEAKAALRPEDADRAFEEFLRAISRLRRRVPKKPSKIATCGSATEPATAAKPSDDAHARLLRIYTNGVADERIKKAALLLFDVQLTADEKLTKIDTLIPFPATASAEQLGDMLGVTKQAVLKTDWWIQNRRGEKDNEIGRRRAGHKERAKRYEAPDA